MTGSRRSAEMANRSGSRPGSTGSQLSSRDRILSVDSRGGTPVSCQPVPAGNAADLGRGQVVQIDATRALSKEVSGGGLITAHGRCGQPTLAKQPFTIGIDQLTHHIPRRR